MQGNGAMRGESGKRLSGGEPFLGMVCAALRKAEGALSIELAAEGLAHDDLCGLVAHLHDVGAAADAEDSCLVG